MSAASAALERDTRHASCNNAEDEFVKRTFINSQYNNKVEEDLVQALIDAKMSAAGFAMERDEHGKRIVGLKKLIQFYAERVATLEVAAARGIAAPSITNVDSDGHSNSTPKSSSETKVQVAAPPEKVTPLLLCGSMYRKSTTSLFNPIWKWEKKYFELRADRLIFYEDESKKPTMYYELYVGVYIANFNHSLL
jgi:hypothetical protein